MIVEPICGFEGKVGEGQGKHYLPQRGDIIFLGAAEVIQGGFFCEGYRDWCLIYSVWEEISQIGARQAGLPHIFFISDWIVVEGFARQDAGTNFREGHGVPFYWLVFNAGEQQ